MRPMLNFESIKNYILTHKKIVAALFIIVLFLIYQSRTSASKNVAPKANVQRQDIKETLTLSGSIAADERTVLAFQTSGQLASVKVKEGDYVKKGQFIASLDQRDLKKRLQKQLNTYSNSRLDFDQTKADYKDVALTDAISRTLDQSQNTLNNAVIDVELNDIALKYANIYSPIEGIVTSVTSPIPGVNVSPSTAQFEIINPKSIYFSSTADQSEVTMLQNGKVGTITLDSFDKTAITSSISSISFVPKSGETSTVYAIKLPLEGSWDEKYRIGMTGDVEFTLNQNDNVLVIPNSFVKEDDNGKKFVYVLKSGKREKRFVKTGIEGDENVEITAGLFENDTVYDFTQ